MEMLNEYRKLQKEKNKSKKKEAQELQHKISAILKKIYSSENQFEFLMRTEVIDANNVADILVTILLEKNFLVPKRLSSMLLLHSTRTAKRSKNAVLFQTN